MNLYGSWLVLKIERYGEMGSIVPPARITMRAYLAIAAISVDSMQNILTEHPETDWFGRVGNDLMSTTVD